MTLVERAVRYLMAQSVPLLMGDVCEGVGVSRGHSAKMVHKLRLHLGARLLSETRPGRSGGRERALYFIEGAAATAARTRKFEPPADLWRGWGEAPALGSGRAELCL